MTIGTDNWLVRRIIATFFFGALSINSNLYAAELHNWVDSTGRYTTKAEFISLDQVAQRVTIKKADGTELTLALPQLDAATQAQAKQLAGNATLPDNLGQPPITAPPLNFPEGFDPKPITIQVPSFGRGPRPSRFQVVSPSNGIVMFTFSSSVASGRPGTLGRTAWYNLKTGLEQECPFTYPSENFEIEAISPGWDALIARDKVDSIDPVQFSLWKINGKELTRIHQFAPFTDDKFRSKKVDVVWCNSRYVFIANEEGPAMLLRVSDFKQIATFPQGSNYAISLDRKTIAFMITNAIAFYSLEDARPIKQVSYQHESDTKPTNREIGGGFSPDGNKFASVDEEVLRIFDWRTGELESELEMLSEVYDDFPDDRTVHWYERDLVVVDSHQLFNVAEGKLLQIYQDAPIGRHRHRYSYFGDRIFYTPLLGSSRGLQLDSFQFPSPEQVEGMGASVAESVAYEHGMPIALDLYGCKIPSIKLGDIDKAIRSYDEKVKFVRSDDPDAQFKLVVKGTPGPGKKIKAGIQDVDVEGGGIKLTYEVKECYVSQTYVIEVTLLHNGRSIFEAKRSIPENRMLVSDDPQAILDRETTPTPYWFLTRIPKLIRSDDYTKKVEMFELERDRFVRTKLD